MGIISSNKQVNVTQLSCDGTARVSLALTAAPDILQNPADIVLVLDRSGSMAGAPLASMKAGADAFIDIIAEASGGPGATLAPAAESRLSAFQILLPLIRS